MKSPYHNTKHHIKKIIVESYHRTNGNFRNSDKS